MSVSHLKTHVASVVRKLNDKADKPVAVVVNTGDENSYGIINNLGREGIPVISVSCDSKNITFASRYAKGITCPDHQDSETAFIDFLVHLGDSLASKPVLFVNGDDQLRVLLKYQDQIGAVFHLPYAPYESMERLVNKTLFYDLLDEIGAPHAQTYLPNNLDEMMMMAPGFEYPCILKPAQSMNFFTRFGNKCLSVNNASEAVDIYSEVIREEDNVIVQQQILGTKRFLVYTYFSSDSKPLGVCCYRKVRIHPIDFGNACVCETVSNDECVHLVMSVLERIGYRGLAEAEVQRDERDGKLKIVEINARSTTENRLSARCGINMEFIAYQEVLGLIRDTDCVINQDMGVLWIDLFRDILAVFSSEGYLAQNKITIPEWWRSLRGRRIFAFWAWNDPLPALKLSVRHLRTYGLKKKRIKDVFSALKSLVGQKTAAKKIDKG